MVASSARAATSRSIRAAKRVVFSLSAGVIARPKVTEVLLGRGASALAQDPARAGNVHRHDRHAGSGSQIGGTTAERLTPAVRAAATFWVDQEAPAVVDEFGGEVGALAAGLRPFDRDCPDTECRHGTGDAGSEEVVGSCTDHDLVPPRLGDRCEQEWGVEVAVMVGREDHRPLELEQAVCALAIRRCEAGDCEAHRAVDDPARAIRAGLDRAHSVS